jgi:hypothetical protein
MTAAERQHLERERNNRARAVVIGLESFPFNAIDLTRQDILNTIYSSSQWAMRGQAFIEETRLLSPPERRAYTTKMFERLNIELPFCRDCGSDLNKDEAGVRLRCKCQRRDEVLDISVTPN